MLVEKILLKADLDDVYFLLEGAAFYFHAVFLLVPTFYIFLLSFLQIEIPHFLLNFLILPHQDLQIFKALTLQEH